MILPFASKHFDAANALPEKKEAVVMINTVPNRLDGFFSISIPQKNIFCKEKGPGLVIMYL
ncbi:hypothetical protein NTGM5_130107 [Candidatus Nitrotoga sp. M5]|nr:hypothetical protein NTGM5_130107 [Candidatus Nitrotoga sp. M5]